MGSLTSRQNVDQEEADISSNHTYKYPPKSGKIFLLVGTMNKNQPKIIIATQYL